MECRRVNGLRGVRQGDKRAVELTMNLTTALTHSSHLCLLLHAPRSETGVTISDKDFSLVAFDCKFIRSRTISCARDCCPHDPEGLAKCISRSKTGCSIRSKRSQCFWSAFLSTEPVARDKALSGESPRFFARRYSLILCTSSAL